MVNRKHFDRLIEKIANLENVYRSFMVDDCVEVEFGIYEHGSPLYSPPSKDKYRPIKKGDKWGTEFEYAWFGADITLPDTLKGKKVYLQCCSDAIESLIFVNNKPVGMFDDYAHHSNWRLHKYLPLDFSNSNCLRLDVEGYASHRLVGTQPYDTLHTFVVDKVSPVRTFESFYLVTLHEDVVSFANSLHLFNNLYSALDENDTFKYELMHVYDKLNDIVDLMPCEGIDFDSLKKANKLINSVLTSGKNKGGSIRAGLIGHSHLDTAWLWKVEETKRKAARTAANAVRLLKKFDDYKFVMSSVLHLWWFKNYYPDLFEDIRGLVKEGKFEPNGAAWVECDCNLTGGEAMIRQFVIGQLFLREEFDYEADSFWLPDTFGYSSALPQIMQKCHVKNFYTTKLSWNDTNKFPYDTFMWEGLDGSQVKSHFNTTHCYAEPKTIVQKVNNTLNKHLSDRILIAYGFGDGGGGPDERMVDFAIRSENIPAIPKAKHMTISEFMKGFDEKSLPVYAGELYLELHRGTYTTNHLLKKLNRKLENALHNLEYAASIKSAFDKRDDIDRLYKVLLLNQFHDILPGTCITEVNELAIKENSDAIAECECLTKQILSDENTASGEVILVNPLSFEYDASVDIGANLDGDYSFIGLDGTKRNIVRAKIGAFSSCSIQKSDSQMAQKSPFKLSKGGLSTEHYSVKFDKNMCIISLFDKRARRELAKGKLNSFMLYRDVPKSWDNWDIDSDYTKKSSEAVLIDSEVILNNAFELRIRNTYSVGANSKIRQDMIFNADVVGVNFETELDWQEKHYLLKTLFDTTIFTKTMKNETQFGYVERSVLDNTSIEQTMFEVCNHKWTDLSENNYGVTLLNDCKYGINAKRGVLGLTLIKSGTHPDTTADNGIRYFNYCFYAHEGGFSFENVTKKAYVYNYSPLVVLGKTQINPLVTSSNEAVIIETVKLSQTGEDIVLRLYECEGNHALTTLSFDREYNIAACNMLEDETSPAQRASKYELELKPFEIATIKLKK